MLQSSIYSNTIQWKWSFIHKISIDCHCKNVNTLFLSSVGRALSFGSQVLGSDLPAVLEVTMGDHSSSSFTIPRCKIGTRSWPGQSELTLRIHYMCKSASGGVSTLSLKHMGRVNPSPKRRVPLAPQIIFYKKSSLE